MFRRRVRDIGSVLNEFLRQKGLETPLRQKRLLDSWGTVAGNEAERYTGEKFIKNQTLFVKINNPALRSDLLMRRTQLAMRLNEAVGAMLITEIRIY